MHADSGERLLTLAKSLAPPGFFPGRRQPVVVAEVAPSGPAPGPAALAELDAAVAAARQLLAAGRGRSLARIIQDLNSVLRGWAGYFQLTETKRVLQ